MSDTMTITQYVPPVGPRPTGTYLPAHSLIQIEVEPIEWTRDTFIDPDNFRVYCDTEHLSRYRYTKAAAKFARANGVYVPRSRVELRDHPQPSRPYAVALGS